MGLTEKQLLKEIRHLNRLLEVATRKATAQYILIDKLTAMNLKMQRLMARLEGR